MATGKEVVLTVTANTGSAKKAIGELRLDLNSLGDAASGVGRKGGGTGKAIGDEMDKAGKKTSGLTGKIKSVSDSFTGLNGAITGAMGAAGLSGFKSMTVDLTVNRMKTKELMAATMGSKQEMEGFYQELKKGSTINGEFQAGTSKSIVSMDMMLDSMNGIKIGTGISNDALRTVRPTIQKVGEACVLMGDDTQHATFVMKEAMSGLNGDFAVLKEQFGITADKMKAAGWDGTAQDIEGYNQALIKCMEPMGDFSKMTDTTAGKIELIKKNFRTAGMDIGEQFVPAIDTVVGKFLDLQNSNDMVSQGILWAGGAVSMLASIAPTISPILDSFSSMKKGLEDIHDAASKAKDIIGKFTVDEDGISVKQKIIDKWKDLKNEILKVKSNLSQDVPTKIGDLKSSIGQKWDTLKSKVGSAVSKLREYNITSRISSAGSSIKGAALSGWDTLKGKVSGAITRIREFSITSKIASAGSAIKGAAISGWTSMTSAIRRATMAIKAFSVQQKLATLATKLHTAAEIVKNGVIKVATAVQAAFNVVMAMNPIMLVVIAVVALIAVLGYLYFNNEQVRNTLNALANTIKGALMAAWNALVSAVQTGWSIISGAWNALSGGINRLASTMSQALGNLPGFIASQFMMMVNMIRMRLTQARAIVGVIINGIRTVIITRIRQIPIQVGIQFMRVVQFIRTRLNQARAIAGSIAGRIRQIIIQRIRAVVSGVQSLFGQVVSTVSSTLGNAAATALSKAQEIYNNIVNKIMEVPQKIGDEFNKIPDRIRSALANAASAALSGAKAIVDAVLGAFHIASPGIIQRKVVGEFDDTATRIGDSTPKAISNAANSAKGVVTAYMSNLQSLPVMNLPINSNALYSDMGGLTRNNFSGSGGVNLGSTSHTVNNNRSDNSKTIIFENVTLDCTNLSTNEARQLFYKAVEGL